MIAAPQIAAAFAGQDLAPLIVAVVAIAGAAIIAYIAMRWSRPRHRQEGPKRGKSRMPTVSATTRRSGGSTSEFRPLTNGRSPSGSLRFKGGDGTEFALGREPAILGSAAECTIVLPGDGIAPEHARIWLRQEKYLLHHVGGLSRKTYVGGQEADWVVLEAGDEVVIGAHRLVFEDKRAAAAEIAVAEPQPAAKEDTLEDDLARMEAAVRELWAEAVPASETAVGERAGTGKYKVHRRKDELAGRVGGQWVKRGRTVVLER